MSYTRGTWKNKKTGKGRPEITCNECDLWGECDHQGAYVKDGKWCYDGSRK